MDAAKNVLIEKYIEHSLTEGEAIQLLTLIKEDPEFKQDVVSALRIHGIAESAAYDDAGYVKLSSVVMNALGPEWSRNSFDTRVMKKISKRMKSARKRKKRSTAMGWQMGIAMAASILIIVGIFAVFQGDGTDPKLVRARLARSGSDTRIIRSEKVLTAETGMKLQVGDTVRTGFDRDVQVKYTSKKTELNLKKGTVLTLKEQDGKNSVDMELGNLSAQVEDAQGVDLEVETTEAVASLETGGGFLLDAEPGWTSLEVIEGEVGFTRKEDNRRIIVKKDHYAIAGMGVEFAPIPIEEPKLTDPEPVKQPGDPEPVVAEHPVKQAVRQPVKPRPAVIPKVLSFTLIDADTDQPVPGFDPIPDGADIDLASLGVKHVNIRANTDPGVCGNVRFDLNNQKRITLECIAPYALKGDTEGDYNIWKFKPGKQTVTAVPFSGRLRKGTKYEAGREGEAKTITFTIR